MKPGGGKGLAWAPLALLAPLLLVGCATPSGSGGGHAPRVFHSRTGDGWSLALRRFSPEGPVRGRPILLVPGLASGDVSLALEPEHGLAYWLAAHGREVWTVSLRGSGDSDRAAPAAGRAATYGFDTLWQQDFRTALETVRAHTGAEAVDVVGYSLGALLVYAYLSEDGEGVGAAVTLAGPTRMDLSEPWLRALSAVGERLIPRDFTLDVGFTAALTAPVQAYLRGNPVEWAILDARNTPRERWARFAGRVFGELSGALVRDLTLMVRTGRVTSADGLRDYRAWLGRVRVPVLVMAGEGDRMAPVPAVRDGYLALGGPKAWRVLGTREGLAVDYGHVDLLLGERAPYEVWAPLLGFLDQASRQSR
ncbi:MAG TPA: alpha/beta fold hydrolase [Myxococcaceae bacterium]|nr:alpha/beta fold hydrolase [Myxococcaceae bacterium]